MTATRRRRVALLGLGMAVRKHAWALADLSDRAEVVGGWSPTEARRAAFAAEHGMPVSDSAERLIEDPSIDLVMILTPPWTHLDLVRRCAEAGRHVLLEKPVEATLARSEKVVRICDAAGVRLGVVLQNRFRTPHQRLRELVRAGRLGGIVSASVAVRWWRGPEYYAEAGRGLRDRDGGGVLLTQAIHALDQLLDLAGEPEAVCGFHATSPGRGIDTEDVAAGALRWANGAIGVLDCTTANYPGTPERIDIAGTEGSAVLERYRLRAALRDGTVIEAGETGDAEAHPGGRDHLAHRRIIVDMLDALDETRPPQVDGHAALPVHQLIDGLLRSGGRAEPLGPAAREGA